MTKTVALYAPAYDDIRPRLEALDLDDLTPREALAKLYELKSTLR